jgi:hypothetical protein
MLSFYEFNCLLEVDQAKLKAIADQLRAANAAKKSAIADPSPPASPAPTLDAAALQKIRSAPPAVAPQTSGGAIRVNKPDINDPTHPNHHNRGANREGIKPSSSKAMKTTAASGDEGEARFLDSITTFNDILSAKGGVSERGMAIMAMAKLGYDLTQVPAGPFIFAAGKPTGRNDVPEVVLPSVDDIAKVKDMVTKFTAGDRAQAFEEVPDLPGAIYAFWAKNPDSEESKVLANKMLQFEKVMHSPKIVNRPMTLAQLAGALGGTSLKGGLDAVANNDEDQKALRTLIRIAQRHGFGHMFDINGDQITVKSLKDLGAVGDPLAKAGSRDVAVNQSLMKGLQAHNDETHTESTGWMDIMDLMEHWSF